MRAPTNSSAVAASIDTSVSPSPVLSVVWSLTIPISRGDGVSPSAWIRNSSTAMAVARTVAGTALTIAAFSGPV